VGSGNTGPPAGWCGAAGSRGRRTTGEALGLRHVINLVGLSVTMIKHGLGFGEEVNVGLVHSKEG
jgi:hypothetical protein